MTATATTQRAKASVNGDTWPTIARPITQLSDQKNEVRLSSRYGEACQWKVRAAIGCYSRILGRPDDRPGPRHATDPAAREAHRLGAAARSHLPHAVDGVG